MDTPPSPAMRDLSLILETSHVAQCGLAVDGSIVRETQLDYSRRHHRDLVPAIQRMLDEIGSSPKQLTQIMVSIGPGSYTGLRVGIMVAKTMSYTLGIPLIAVPTYATIANRTPIETMSVDVIADALQGTAYVQRFGPADAMGNRLPMDVLRIETFAEWYAKGTATLTGPGVDTFQKLIHTSVVEPVFRLPTVESTYRIGRTLTPLDRSDMLGLEPLYLRGSSAEEKAKKMADN